MSDKVAWAALSMMAGDSIRFAAIVNRELEALRDYLTQRYRIALETGV